MPKKLIPQRTRFFFAVEGESEQSLIKWFQELADKNGLHIYLDCEVIDGGGYKTMLAKAVRQKKRRDRKTAKSSILLVDADRAERDDPWSIDKLRQEAAKHKITVCVQTPNLEGVLLRLIPGKESLQPSAASAKTQLSKIWPAYKKPADAHTLAEKFTLADLLRAAKVDLELNNLLSIIGLRKTINKNYKTYSLEKIFEG